VQESGKSGRLISVEIFVCLRCRSRDRHWSGIGNWRSARGVAGAIHARPTLCEAFHEAALHTLGHALHILNLRSARTAG
jgi:hypothetical protein